MKLENPVNSGCCGRDGAGGDGSGSESTGCGSCMERSERLPVALLAVLKSGSCDGGSSDSRYPRQRITATLAECKPVAVLSDSAVAPSLGKTSGSCAANG